MTMSFFGDKKREDELFYALAQELVPVAAEGASDASVTAPEAGVKDALASVIVSLAKFAEKLEDVGHPSAARVDSVLDFIEKEFTTETQSG